jgi:hypothetical protein
MGVSFQNKIRRALRLVLMALCVGVAGIAACAQGTMAEKPAAGDGAPIHWMAWSEDVFAQA